MFASFISPTNLTLAVIVEPPTVPAEILPAAKAPVPSRATRVLLEFALLASNPSCTLLDSPPGPSCTPSTKMFI